MSSTDGCGAYPAPPSWPARGLLLLIEAYRALLAPLLGGHCRYWPSCSVYAEEALRLHGAARGSLLAARRLLRCHPLHRGGPDPVPLPHPRHGRVTHQPPFATAQWPAPPDSESAASGDRGARRRSP